MEAVSSQLSSITARISRSRVHSSSPAACYLPAPLKGRGVCGRFEDLKLYRTAECYCGWLEYVLDMNHLALSDLLS